jgi:DNA-binding transcriptional ArsR family regulator
MDRVTDPQVPLFDVKADLFKGLAHPVRIRILELLAAEGTMAVSDMLAGTGLEASHLSQHLSVLRRHHLVTSTRRGSQVFYELACPQVSDLLANAREVLLNVLQTTQDHLVRSLAQTAPAPPAPADNRDL